MQHRKGVSQSFRLSVLGQLVRIDAQLVQLVPHKSKNPAAANAMKRLEARKTALMESLQQHEGLAYTEIGTFSHLGRQGVINRSPELITALPSEIRP